jgi:zinc D-Ala-D-Ala carboxypeptidase
MIDDIPEARREPVAIKKSSGSPFPLIISGGFILLAIAVCLIWFFNRSPSSVSQEKPSAEVVPAKVAPAENQEVTENSNQATLSANQPLETKIEDVDNVLGHLPYKQASESELVTVTNDGRVRLQKAAAEKFLQMQADAKSQGINLSVISGFRSVEDQDKLFFDVKEQRVQGATKRAEVSAPPGYSEHHTGYAVDLGDANVPATNLNSNFEQTAAFQWLEQNAAKYSFELSFPKDNAQGISYEPWHWRFVGDRTSLETFYKAKKLK